LGPGATPGAPTNISPAASTAAAPGGAAATSGLSSLFTAKNLPLLLGAGGLAYVLAKGEQSLPPQAVQAEQQATELNALGLQELATAQNNQITPQQAAAIQINQQQQIAQAYQQVASMGQDPQNSSTYLSMVQQINNNALAEQVAYIQQNINTALTETGQANSDLLAVAQIQVQEDEDFQQALTTALSSFGLIAALSGINAAKAA